MAVRIRLNCYVVCTLPVEILIYVDGTILSSNNCIYGSHQVVITIEQTTFFSLTQHKFIYVVQQDTQCGLNE